MGSHEEPGQAKIEIQQVPRCLPDASHSLCPDMTPVPWPTGQFLLLLCPSCHQARDLGLRCSPAPQPLSIHLPYPHPLHLGCDQCPLPDLLIQRPLSLLPLFPSEHLSQLGIVLSCSHLSALCLPCCPVSPMVTVTGYPWHLLAAGQAHR